MTHRPAIIDRIDVVLRAAYPEIRINTDPNFPFEPPADALFAEVVFVDGSEEGTSIGGDTIGIRQPILVYVDLRAPIGMGVGEVVVAEEVLKAGLRRFTVPGARWWRFEQGAEGRDGADYRKQVVALFMRSDRV